MYESVNVKDDPQLKDLLLRNELNAVTCGGCNFVFRVDKPLVYSDPALKVLIYLFPTDEAAYDKNENKFLDVLAELTRAIPEDVPAPSLHLVFSRTELIERIFLREAGLDERIIEYIKYTIYAKNGRKLNPSEKALLFNAHDSNESTLCFVVQDVNTRKFEAVLNYERAGYNALSETFTGDDKSFDLLELFPGPYISARHALIRELRAESETEADGD